MGWCIILKMNVIIKMLGIAGFVLLLCGGISYTVGAILYGVGKKKKWMHSIFHIACVIGTLLQFLCVVMFVL
jgi:hemolysin III